MAWELAKPDDLETIVTRLGRAEWQHVAFSSRLVEGRKTSFPNPRLASIYLNRSDGSDEIREALFVNHLGLVLPVLSDGTGVRRDIRSLLENVTRPIHSIMGEASAVLSVEKGIQRKIRASVDYHLMVYDPASSGTTGSDACADVRVRVHRARPRDSVQLFPLQREYEKEEVLIEPDRFNASASYLNLQRTLKREIVFYAEVDRRIVAKAGTNARGLVYDQLGGVYTVPEYRNTGIATRLVSSLIEYLAHRDRGVCLFVKRDNSAALRLYEKIGFATRGDFRITYYS